MRNETELGRWSESFMLAAVLAAFVCGPTGVIAADTQILFERGKSAMARQDYIEAAEALFAYRELDRELLSRHPDFERRVEENLRYAESQLSTALETFRRLQSQGNVVAVEIESGGKFDAPGVREARRTKPFHLSSPPAQPARGLGSRPQESAELAHEPAISFRPGELTASQDLSRLRTMDREGKNGELQEKYNQLRVEHQKLKKRYLLLEERCKRIR